MPRIITKTLFLTRRARAAGVRKINVTVVKNVYFFIAPPISKMKVILVGEANSGKSSLLMRFLRDRFDSSVPTVAPECASRTIEAQSSLVKLCMWDIAGQERFRSVAKSYYRNADAALLVCCNRASFAALPYWLRELQQAQPAGVEPRLILLFNKCDEPAQVDDAEIALFCARHNVERWYRVSAKTGERVQEAFRYLAESLRPEAEADQPSLEQAPPRRWCSIL